MSPTGVGEVWFIHDTPESPAAGLSMIALSCTCGIIGVGRSSPSGRSYLDNATERTRLTRPGTYSAPMNVERVASEPTHEAALLAALRLRGWLQENDLRGVDPYDALRSPVLGPLGRTPLLRQVIVQALRRLPVDPRPLLGIRAYDNAKGLGIIAAASARLWAATQDDEWRVIASRAADRAADLALETRDGPAWGYPFDVQVRWGYYDRSTPNAIASVFTAGGLIVAGEILGRADLVRTGEAVAGFLDALATTEGGEQFYAYVPGNRTPIHNASLLVAALRARVAARQKERLPAEADAAITYSLARQREDGSWPYGEAQALGWVDGFHTAYVLLALLDLESTTRRDDVEAALSLGYRYYRSALFDADGLPLNGPGARYPLDSHNVATAITALLRLSGRDPGAGAVARSAADLAIFRLQTPQGWFVYQRGRRVSKRVAYLRWSDAHMLNALAEAVSAERRPAGLNQAAAVPLP